MNRLLSLALIGTLCACGGTSEDDSKKPEDSAPVIAELQSCEGDLRIFKSSATKIIDPEPGVPEDPAFAMLADEDAGVFEYFETPEELAKCQRVTGDVLIQETYSLTDLSDLSSLVSIGGRLDIRYNADLSSLKGLEKLKTVGDSIYINSNPQLTGVADLQSLERVQRLTISENQVLDTVQLGRNPMIIDRMSISRNDQLRLVDIDQLVSANSVYIYSNGFLQEIHIDGEFTTLDSLSISSNDILAELKISDSLKRVESELNLSSNRYLPSIDGFEQLEHTGELTIRNSTNLTQIYDASFARLKTIEGNLEISQNPRLTDLPTFPELLSVGENLFIRQNESLIELNGFRTLEYVRQIFEISDNVALKQIHAFSNLNSTYDLTLVNLPALEKLPALNFLNYVDNLHLIGNNALQNLEGLENIKGIRHNLVLANQLLSLEGLDSLEWVHTGLAIFEEPLEDYDGLGSLARVGRLLLQPPTDKISADDQKAFAQNLQIRLALSDPASYGVNDVCIGTLSNLNTDSVLVTPLQYSVEEFAHCKVITGSLNIWAQSRGIWDAPRLSPLNDLVEVWGDVNIAIDIYEELEQRADGFPALKWIGGDLVFTGMLSKIDFVPHLEHLGGSMFFEYVDDWSALPSFEHLKP